MLPRRSSCSLLLNQIYRVGGAARSASFATIQIHRQFPITSPSISMRFVFELSCPLPVSDNTPWLWCGRQSTQYGKPDSQSAAILKTQIFSLSSSMRAPESSVNRLAYARICNQVQVLSSVFIDLMKWPSGALSQKSTPLPINALPDFFSDSNSRLHDHGIQPIPP